MRRWAVWGGRVGGWQQAGERAGGRAARLQWPAQGQRQRAGTRCAWNCGPCPTLPPLAPATPASSTTRLPRLRQRVSAAAAAPAAAAGGAGAAGASEV